MKVLHVNTSDTQGGAAIAGYRLHSALRRQGIDSRLLVGFPRSEDPLVTSLGERGLLTQAQTFGSQLLGLNYLLLTRGWNLKKQPLWRNADVINLHNLHRGYINYALLFRQLRERPVVYTLHDMWGLTGHCSYSFDCQRWRSGCGHCPHKSTYPKVYLDNTRLEWRLKRRLTARLNMHVVAPSRWLAQCARESLLGVHPVHHIPNGIDLSVFSPLDRAQCRERLGIPKGLPVVCYAAENLRDPRKGWPLLRDALERMSRRLKTRIALLTLGHDQGIEVSAQIQHFAAGYVVDDRHKAEIYSAADVFVLPSLADNLPLVLQEAMACGTAVAGFDIGGVGDIAETGVTGALAADTNADALCDAVEKALELAADAATRRACRETAEARFDLQTQGRRYHDLYKQLTKAA